MELDTIDTNQPVKLSVPLLATYLKKGYSQAKIASILNVTRQAVNDYIKRHSDDLAPLKHTNDDYMATLAQTVAIKAMGKLETHLDQTSKKDLIALNAISGTHIEKYRLLSNQSTENTVNMSLVADVNELLKSLKE